MSTDEQWKKPTTVGSGRVTMTAIDSRFLTPATDTVQDSREGLSKNVLETADQVIHGQRAEDYGSAEASFTRIAEYWSIHLGIEVTGHDVAMMMTLMKVARAKTDKKLDTYVDIAGYAALAPRLITGWVQ